MRIIASFIIAATLALGGCATFDSAAKSVFEGGLSITAEIINPIGVDQLYEVEAGYGVAVRTALAYKRLRQCRRSEVESLANPCARRAVVVRLAELDRKVRGFLLPMREFVKNNDKVSAVAAFNAVRAALADYKAEIFTVTQVVGVK